MLTVIQTLPALDVGGVERGTLEVAAELVKRGHRSIVVSAGGSLVRELVENGSEHIQLSIGEKSPLTLKYIPGLKSLLKETSADILHARSRLPAWISYLAWRGISTEHRPGLVTSVHGAYSVNPYSKIMTRGERVIAVSDFIYHYILDNYPGTDRNNIITIPRGVSPARFPYGFRPAADWLQDWQNQHRNIHGRFLITLPGRITRRKGLADFLEIIARLKSVNMSIHGLVAGGADNKNLAFLHELKARAKTAGIEDHITFLGHREDMREIISVSRIVLSLSKKPESFGRTALESLSMGVPVIAYDRGGSGEILREIFPAGLIEPDNTDQATGLIQNFYNNRPVVPQQNIFTLERMLNNTINLYEDLSGARSINRQI